MGIFEVNDLSNVRTLVSATQASDEPVVVLDGEDECLVAMRPAVFERILFDGMCLNAAQRTTMHL